MTRLAAGLFADWTVRDGHTLHLSNVFLETLDRFDYRNLTRFEWKIRLTQARGLSLKLDLRNEYDSASEKSKNELDYYTALSFDL